MRLAAVSTGGGARIGPAERGAQVSGQIRARRGPSLVTTGGVRGADRIAAGRITAAPALVRLAAIFGRFGTGIGLAERRAELDSQVCAGGGPDLVAARRADVAHQLAA
jgi:hypothetical protein